MILCRLLIFLQRGVCQKVTRIVYHCVKTSPVKFDSIESRLPVKGSVQCWRPTLPQNREL